jgi:hypothetical protein
MKCGAQEENCRILFVGGGGFGRAQPRRKVLRTGSVGHIMQSLSNLLLWSTRQPQRKPLQ